MQDHLEAASHAFGAAQPTEIVAHRSTTRIARATPDFSINQLFYHSEGTNPPLRIGVMMDGSHAQLFMRKVLEDVSRCNYANIVAVIENATPSPTKSARPSAPARALRMLLDGQRRRGLSHLAYTRWIDKRYHPSLDPRTNVDCSDLLANSQHISVTPIRTRYVDRFPEDALEEIRRLELDVILRFGFRIIRGGILHVARCGVWSFHHGDSERYRGGPALTWELLEHNPLSGAVLQWLDESLDAGPVLCRGMLATSQRPSVSANRYNVYWSTQHFPIQKLYELHRFGVDHLLRRRFQPGAYRGRKPIYRKPTNLAMARWLAPTMVRAAVRKLKRRKEVTHWRIGLRQSATALHQNPDAAALGQFAWINGPRGRFWADPFLIEDGGDAWMLFEDYSYAEKRGVISCGRIENGQATDVRRVLDLPYHISFPHVFRHDGAIWMIPETHQAKQVQLFRASRFPDEWVLERTLLNLPGTDTSVFEHQGRWYMFVSPMIVEGHVSNTLLFVAPRLEGPWTLHPAGSICRDVRWARCAGAIIRDGDRLIRPSQDCSAGYGYSISFNEIKVLDEMHYEEAPGAQFRPDPRRKIFGVHSYNRAGDWEVIDGRALTPRAAHL